MLSMRRMPLVGEGGLTLSRPAPPLLCLKMGPQGSDDLLERSVSACACGDRAVKNFCGQSQTGTDGRRDACTCCSGTTAGERSLQLLPVFHSSPTLEQVYCIISLLPAASSAAFAAAAWSTAFPQLA